MNTQVIYRFAYAQVKCTVIVLLSNCIQSITSLSLLFGMTVGILGILNFNVLFLFL